MKQSIRVYLYALLSGIVLGIMLTIFPIPTLAAPVTDSQLTTDGQPISFGESLLATPLNTPYSGATVFFDDGQLWRQGSEELFFTAFRKPLVGAKCGEGAVMNLTSHLGGQQAPMTTWYGRGTLTCPSMDIEVFRVPPTIPSVPNIPEDKIPEPRTMFLSALGFLCLVLLYRRENRAK